MVLKLQQVSLQQGEEEDEEGQQEEDKEEGQAVEEGQEEEDCSTSCLGTTPELGKALMK
jgi:hypothetical protein